MNTKDRILKNALTLFSEHGFDSVSVRDIAKATNIKASSIYNHFENKKDIFDCIITTFTDKYLKDLKHILKTVCSDDYAAAFKKMSSEDFADAYLKVFSYYFKNQSIIKFRKMLIIEKFHNKKVFDLYRKLFIDDILVYNTNYFKILIENKLFPDIDPNILSLELYSPIFVIFSRTEHPVVKDLESIKKHLIYFKNYYTLRI